MNAVVGAQTHVFTVFFGELQTFACTTILRTILSWNRAIHAIKARRALANLVHTDLVGGALHKSTKSSRKGKMRSNIKKTQKIGQTGNVARFRTGLKQPVDPVAQIERLGGRKIKGGEKVVVARGEGELVARISSGNFQEI